MKILVLGAAGAMAEVVRRDLAEFSPGTAVTIADQRELAAKYPNERPATVDVARRGGDGAAPRRARRGAQLRHLLPQPAGDARRARGAGAVHRLGRPLPRQPEAVRAPRRVRRGGSAGAPRHGLDARHHQRHGRLPGARARRGARGARAGRLPRPRAPAGPLPIPYALDTVLDEFALEPWSSSTATAHPVPPRSGEEEIDFPPPVGRMRAIYTLHSEVAMFPRSFPGLAGASFKVAFEPLVHGEGPLPGRARLRRARAARRWRLAAPDAARARRRAGLAGRRARRLRRACGSISRASRTAGPCGAAASAIIGPAPRPGASAPARSTPACRSRSPASCSPRREVATPGCSVRSAPCRSSASSRSSRGAVSGSASRTEWTTHEQELMWPSHPSIPRPADAADASRSRRGRDRDGARARRARPFGAGAGPTSPSARRRCGARRRSSRRTSGASARS